MDSILQFTVIFLIVSLTFYYILGRSWKTKSGGKNKKLAPEPDGGLPIIGHLNLLGRDEVLHRKLGRLADKYGPAFTLRLGHRPIVVLSRWEEAKECFTTNDKYLISRPLLTARKLLGYNYATFGFAPYSDYWREMRKIATSHLLKSHRVDFFKDVWESEIREGVRVLYKQCTSDHARKVPVNLTQWSADMMTNVIVRMVAGKRHFAFSGDYPESEVRQLQTAFRRLVELAGAVVVSDAVPFLGWMDNFLGQTRGMKQVNEELNVVIEQWLDEHRRDRKRRVQSEDEEDLFDKMLSLQEKGQLMSHPHTPDICIKATCLEIMMDGFETTATTLTWAIACLMNHPQALKKAQEELDTVVGRDRSVDDSDIPKLPYLQAVVKETTRRYPAGPLLSPREATEDCTVAGYYIPKGTQIMVNAWKLQHDPRVWKEPFEFHPERFLTDHAHVDLKGQNYELLPFSSGRRSCPGMWLGTRLVQLSLARLLHGFELVNPTNKPIDMAEVPSLSLAKATPVEIILIPRLDAGVCAV
ncbi:xanthotoxin 5-hydroxylase CYP82C4-like [Punica granatum]|uniref:Xanthotoxin 5-hydroxylase CYP82C4-like n=1 Tax=Punica granatum TaxID=22663 RepID=A0A6P8EF62_PUNGR|nr:xanthotoxin 5-hydroxylase CYP82C4-like [Punica granatum]